MMLYHVPDSHRGLDEVRRVLSRYGVRDPLNRRFTLQNGEMILKQHFSAVVREDYPDALEVTDPEDLADYLYSLGSMTALDPAYRPEIIDTLRWEMKNGVLTAPKEYGMFLCC